MSETGGITNAHFAEDMEAGQTEIYTNATDATKDTSETGGITNVPTVADMGVRSDVRWDIFSL